jgi:hypothetical protein
MRTSGEGEIVKHGVPTTKRRNGGSSRKPVDERERKFRYDLLLSLTKEDDSRHEKRGTTIPSVTRKRRDPLPLNKYYIFDRR